jgi:hypothetical protein
MLLLLLPAQIAMVAILLANGFEFVEALAQRDLRRQLPPAGDAGRERAPAARVDASGLLQRAARDGDRHHRQSGALDYPELRSAGDRQQHEADEALVEARSRHAWRSWGREFRFFHLAQWPGFKAGALNFALSRPTRVPRWSAWSTPTMS